MAQGHWGGPARALRVSLVGSQKGETARSPRQTSVRVPGSAPGRPAFPRWHAGRAALAVRFAPHAGGGHRLVRAGHADHAGSEIQDQPPHRLGSRSGDGLSPVSQAGVSAARSPAGADRLGTLEPGGAHPTQAVCGAALAVTVTVATFWLFGLR